MTTQLLIKVIIAWFMFIPIAVLNGIIRDKLYKLYVGDLPAHQISTLIIVIAYGAFAYFVLRGAVGGIGTGALLSVGVIWVVMTVCFEFGIGRFISGRSWEWLLQDYNVFKGRLWGVFVLFVLFSPFVAKLLSRWLDGR